MNLSNQEFIGVDVGAARVGIARGASLAKIAQPLKSVAANDALAEIESLSIQNQVAGIVVGLPRGLDGNETPQTKAVRGWVQTAKSQIKLPFYWQDEALTSQKAESLKLKASPGSDAEAAAIILQDFLDTLTVNRVEA